MSFSTSSRTSERPTLPSIHTLDLPFFQKATHASGESASSTRFDAYGQSPSRTSFSPRARYTHGLRKASTSSSNTSASRSPSPESFACPSSAASSCDTSDSDMPPSPRSISSCSSASSSSSMSCTPSAPFAGQVRLVPCSFEEANAVILVPPPSALQAANPTPASNGPLLLVGSAMQYFVRHPQRETSKGARVHPYRIVHPKAAVGSSKPATHVHARRSSIPSMVSLPVN